MRPNRVVRSESARIASCPCAPVRSPRPGAWDRGQCGEPERDRYTRLRPLRRPEQVLTMPVRRVHKETSTSANCNGVISSRERTTWELVGACAGLATGLAEAEGGGGYELAHVIELVEDLVVPGEGLETVPFFKYELAERGWAFQRVAGEAVRRGMARPAGGCRWSSI